MRRKEGEKERMVKAQRTVEERVRVMRDFVWRGWASEGNEKEREKVRWGWRLVLLHGEMEEGGQNLSWG